MSGGKRGSGIDKHQGIKRRVAVERREGGKEGHQGEAGLIYATRRPTSWVPRAR